MLTEQTAIFYMQVKSRRFISVFGLRFNPQQYYSCMGGRKESGEKKTLKIIYCLKVKIVVKYALLCHDSSRIMCYTVQ